MQNWDQIYQDQGPVQIQPSKQIIQLVPFFKEEGVQRILDHGCGTGRHVKYLAQQGFYVVGTDYSESALQYTASLASGLENVILVKADMNAIPFPDGYFDAMISNHVIQHALKDVRDKAFQELERSLKLYGLLFLRTPSRMHRAYGTGRQVEPHTYIDIPNIPDGKNPHHYFSDDELREYLNRFEILKIEHHSLPPNDFFKLGVEEWAVLAGKR